MNIKLLVLAATTAALLSGCTSGVVYSELPAPQENIDPSNGWEPYGRRQETPPVPRARPSQGNWDAPRPISQTRVEHAELPPTSDFQTKPEQERPEINRSPLAREGSQVLPDVTGDSAFKRAEPKDPPADLSARRRTYSSRPEKNEALPRSTSVQPTTVTPLVGSNVRSEWADKAVRPGNRQDFDAMVRDSARLGNGSFEDENGRIYYGEKTAREGKCAVVEVTVTTNGGLPIVARGTAYAC